MNKYVSLIAGAIIGIAYSGLAATADITGLNTWEQTGDPAPITVTTDNYLSGNASLVFDASAASLPNWTAPEAVLASPVSGGIVTITVQNYFPSSSTASFLFGFDDAGSEGCELAVYNDWGVTQNYGTVYAYNGPSTGSFTLLPDAWKTIKLVVDLDHPGDTAGSYYYDGVFAGNFAYNDTQVVEVWFAVGPSVGGISPCITGPIYFDDLVVQQGATTVWSDNFDSYIAYGDPNLISIDAVANGSVAVSGSVPGGPGGQLGLWNVWTLDGSQDTLSNLKDGTGATTGVGFVFDVDNVGYHVQPGDAPYDPGVVLAADNPERAWVTGGESPVTFKFTGLTVGGNYSLAIFTTGDPLMTLTVNGTPTLNPGDIFTTTATADSNGEIVMQVSCGGDAYSDYAEIAGLQLLKLAAAPALAAHAGSELNLSPSTPSGTIGGSPTATGGTGPYTYSWTPTTGLDDPTLANPTASPTVTTTYTVTVTDSLSATATASVVVTYTVPALVADAGPAKSVSAGSPSVQIGGSPTASGGSGPYTYSWTPTTGLSDPTAANPTASPIVTTTYTVTVTDSLSATATASVTVSYLTGNANLISLDVVTPTSVPVSGDVAGGLTGLQVGPWNSLVGSAYSTPLSNLKNGAGATTGVGFTASRAGYGGFQVGSNPSITGVVLSADNPERLWVSGAGVLTFTFTGLTVGASYNLAIFNTGDPRTIITINGGTPHTGIPTILTTTEVADGSGNITGVMSFNGAQDSGYAEISGWQLESLALPPPPAFPASGFSQPGGVPTFAIPGTVSTSTYTLYYKDNLTDPTWTALTGSGTGTGNGGTLTLSDPTSVGSLPAHRYYRLGRNP